jgi:hypothetical protein
LLQVSPGEAARWAALLRALGRTDAPPPAFPVERAILKMAAQRVGLAEKVGWATGLCAQHTGGGQA